MMAAPLLAAAGLGAQIAGQSVEIRTIGGGQAPAEIASMLGGRSLEPMAIGTGLVVGQAVDADDTRPIPGALVTLSLPGVAPLRVLADSQGRFAFRSLPAGRFSLSASKPGYVDGAHGQRRPDGTSQPLELAEGERLASANVTLWRHAAITGTVTDEFGEPVIGATVHALRRTFVAGMPKLEAGPSDRTDDRGIYRIGSLTPGDYVVVLPSNPGGREVIVMGSGGAAAAARAEIVATFARAEAGVGESFADAQPEVGPAGTAPDGTPLTFQTVFYPESATPARATTVRLGSGEERTGVDFARLAVPASTVIGTVTGPDGPAANHTVTLVPAGFDDVVSPLGLETARTNAAGQFRLTSIAPGQYTLRVVQMPRMRMPGRDDVTVASGGGGTMMVRTFRAVGPGAVGPLPDEPVWWAEIPVAVDGPTTSVTVPLSAGLRVAGQVEFTGEGERPPADQLPSIRVTLEPADGRTSALDAPLRGRIETTGQFKTMAVPPGKYFVRADGLPQDWHFRGATYGGRDVTDEPLTIESEDVDGVTLTFTSRQTELTGSVTASDGTEDSGAVVIVFPADRRGWTNFGNRPRRLQSARVGARGAFRIDGLPAGDYLIAAVSDEHAADWQRPDFLEAVARGATRLRLSEGERQTQALRMIR